MPLKYNDLGHICPRTKRVCVSYAEYDQSYEEMGDELSAYTYSEYLADCGLEPWSPIEGAEKVNEDVALTCGGHTRFVPVDSCRVYLRRAVYAVTQRCNAQLRESLH